MATKKRGRKKKSQEVVNSHELPGGFWRQIMALLMICAAIVFVVTWMGKGGEALQKVNDASLHIFGYTTFLFPVLLTYLAVMIFRAQNNRLDASVWVASVLMIFWFCGAFGVPTYGQAEPTGGIVGEGLNSIAVKTLGNGVAIFAYVVLILITALFMYAETPAALFRKIGSIFKTSKNEEDVKNAKVMRRASGHEIDPDDDGLKNFRVNSNVEIADSKKEKHGLLAKRTNDTEKRPVAEESTALMAISDPNWEMPSIDLLSKKRSPADPGDTHNNAAIIKDTLEQFGINVEVEGANVGPRITQYTLRPPAGVKVSKIATLDRDLALNLAKDKIRIEAPIPGTRTVGIEIPNNKAASVGLHELLKSNEWHRMIADKPLAFTVGKDISGKPIMGNLAKMPHLLIAGTTGSGKSVMTNTLITSMLYHNSPADLRLIIVDPKQVEMAAYEAIPHLLAPIITNVSEALSAMQWAVKEMEQRYTVMKDARVKNIVDYNEKMAREGMPTTIQDEDGNPQKHDNGKMPYIVVIVDEMADLMMMAGKELETLIVRIAQKGRAAGIHLVLATQRPEVKVVTGLIKANIPGRIAFAVNNNTDSRVMLDMGGAEKLLGSGDMLFLTTEMMGKPLRVQGAYLSDPEIAKVTDFLRQQAPANYNEEVTSQQVVLGGKGSAGVGIDMGGGAGGDVKRQAVEVALREGKISTSLLQRRLRIGYGRAAAIIDELSDMGIVGDSSGGNKGRELLITSMDEYDNLA